MKARDVQVAAMLKGKIAQNNGKIRNVANDKKRKAKAKRLASRDGKVASCHKCHKWFASFKDRNAHKSTHR